MRERPRGFSWSAGRGGLARWSSSDLALNLENQQPLHSCSIVLERNRENPFSDMKMVKRPSFYACFRIFALLQTISI